MLRLVDFASQGNKRRIFVCNFVIVSLIYWSSNVINYILSVFFKAYTMLSLKRSRIFVNLYNIWLPLQGTDLLYDDDGQRCGQIE